MCADDSTDGGVQVEKQPLPPPSVLKHIVDVHCHPTDSPIAPDLMAALPIRVCAMATRQSDQQLVADLSTAYPDKVTPCFGYHPWFTHWIALADAPSKREHYAALLLGPAHTPAQTDAFQRLLPALPNPLPLSAVLADLRARLAAFPHAMLGEVGLDRACRIPYGAPAAPPFTASDAERRELSPFGVPLDHQLAVLEAQIAVAVELRRNVSMHSVKCQQATVELLRRMKTRFGDRWEGISVDMHSCGLSAQTWADIQRVHSNLFLSLSTAINARSPAHKGLIATCSPTRILVESDYHDIALSTPYTVNMLRTIAEIKGWTIEDTWDDSLDGEVGRADAHQEKWGAVRRLEANWRLFERGGHKPMRKKDKKKLVLEDWESDEEDRVPLS